MTFFYDLNKKLADIGAKTQLNEDARLDEKYMGFSKLEKEIAKRGDVRDPGAVAASIGRKKYGKEKFQKAAAAGKKLGEQDDIRPPRHPQALDYQQGPEDDAEYRRHHGLDDPDRKRERRLRATDHKTLDRLERQAVDRAKQIDEISSDPLQRRGYMSSINKNPRKGQTNFDNIPAGNHPDSRNRFTDDDRKSARTKLKRDIKQSLGQHKKPNRPENTDIEEGNDPDSQKFGRAINKYFGEIYAYGDDGLDYLDRYAPFWLKLFLKHDGDIDTIIANEPATVLKKAALELKQIANDLPYELGEASVGEGNEFSFELAKAKASGAKQFKVDGKTYPVKEGEVEEEADEDSVGVKYGVYRRGGSIGSRSGLIKTFDSKEEAQEYVKLQRKSLSPGERRYYKISYSVKPIKEEVEEGRNDPSPLDDPLTRFRKKHAPSVMRDPKGREELSKLDTEHSERKKTAYGRGEEDDEDDEDGKKKDKPAGEKRGRGRPKGSKRAIGAKGPTGRSKLLTRKEGVEEDYDRDEYDEEGEMAQSQARTIEDAAEELQAILDADENLPEWVQKKITLAKEYIDSARDYLKANRPEGGEMSLPEDADNGFTQADWNRVVGLKRMLMRMNRKLEPEDAEQRAAEKLGYDYEDVLAWIESDQNLEEKAVSKAQRRAAGIAHAAKKGAIPKSELRGASKEMAKMAGGELKKFAKTKEKGLPEKKTEEVEETTTAGNVAPGGDAPAKGGKKGGMQFGKGIYDSMNRELEAMIAESMNVSVNMNSEGPNGPTKSVTVTATDEDADMLAALLTRSGLGGGMQSAEACPGCGKAPCGCAEQVDENEPDYPTDPVGSDDAMQYAGGLNKPKSTGQTTTPIIANQDEREVAYDDDGDELRRIREMAGIQEEKKSKPDFPDIDKDGNRKETMSQAAKDKAAQEEEKVDESVERGLWSLWQRIQ